jgi:hypothetical protein
VRRREEAVADLVATLERLGIQPIGSEHMDSTVWVKYKEVDPFAVGEPAEEEVA